MHSFQRSLPFHYGWIIALTGAATLFACLGLARFAFGMLLPSMGDGLGLGYDRMGLVSTGNFAGYLAAVLLAPSLIRRFRPRAAITGGLLLLGLCMLGLGAARSFGEVLSLYAAVGLGSGFANIPVMILVSHWFRSSRRGRAAGLMTIGNGLAIIFSGLLIPLLNQELGAEGWRTAWLLLGLICLGVALLAALLLRNDPADLGLEPAGPPAHFSPERIRPSAVPSKGRTLLQLGGLYFLFGVTYMVYGTFIVTSLVTEHGFPEARAGHFWSWIGFFSLFSGVGFGALSDRIGRRGGLALVFLVQTAAYLLAAWGPGTWALLLSVVLYGISAFAIPTIMAAAVADYLGLARAASGFAAVTLFFAIGQTIGPGAAGLLAEGTGSFATGFLASAVLTALAAVLTTALPRPPVE